MWGQLAMAVLPSLIGGAVSSHGSAQAVQQSANSTEKQMNFQREANQKQMDFQKESIDKQMGFQTGMANTSHQRQIKDLIAAGLNPILAAGGSGATSPSGSTSSGATSSGASYTGDTQSGYNANASALATKRLGQELTNMRATEKQTKSNTYLAEEQKLKTTQDLQNSKEQRNVIKQSFDLLKEQTSSAKSAATMDAMDVKAYKLLPPGARILKSMIKAR